MNHFTIKGTTLIKKEKETAKLRMAGGSWSINLDTLPELVSELKYITEKGTYTITRSKAFSVGFPVVLRGEQKLVVPVVHWTRS
jgi:hypothetical protein